jgi:hypothetical protein
VFSLTRQPCSWRSAVIRGDPYLPMLSEQPRDLGLEPLPPQRPRAGNRRLNHVLYMAGLVQLRNDTPGRAYYCRRVAEGKTPMEVMRCLRRRLSAVVYRQLAADAQSARQAGPGGHSGATGIVQRGRPSPGHRHFGPATRQKRKFTRALVMHRNTTSPLSERPCRVANGAGGSLITAHRAAVISTSGWTVHDVADASVLWALCCVVETLSGLCLRRGPPANTLVDAAFRI